MLKKTTRAVFFKNIFGAISDEKLYNFSKIIKIVI